jgi:hypothetical protein
LVRCHVTGAESLAESESASCTAGFVDGRPWGLPVTLRFSQILQSATVHVLCVCVCEEYECVSWVLTSVVVRCVEQAWKVLWPTLNSSVLCAFMRVCVCV